MGDMKKSHKRGAGTPAIVALDKAGISYTTHPYEHDPMSALGYGLEAAAAIGVEADQVFKTLVTHVGSALVVGIVPVSRQLDLKALAAAMGAKKASMADPSEAERATGYVVGGVSPIGQRQRLATILDESALNFDTVYVSGGRRGLDIGLCPGDLITITKAKTAPIAR